MSLKGWVEARLDFYSELDLYKVASRAVTFKEVKNMANTRADIFSLSSVRYVFCEADNVEDYIVSFLACVLSGKTIVPVSRFKTEISVFQQKYIGAVYWDGECLSDKFIGKKSLSYLDDDVYCLFTSGSTGEPKGIIVNELNLTSYINNILELGFFSGPKLISCNFNPVFDLFYHDFLIALENGLTMQIPTMRESLFRHEYFNNYKFDIWFSTPTHVANIISRAVPSRDLISLFCGEALPCKLLKNWLVKTESQLSYNLYGPTESTIAVTVYEYHVDNEHFAANGIVSIGEPFGKNRIRVSDGSILEIIGNQVARYLDNNTSAGGFYNDAENRVFNTKDKAVYDRNGYNFLGRVDNQIKINGNRIELGELQLHALNIQGVEGAIVKPVVDGLVCCGFEVHYNGCALKEEIISSYVKKFNGVFSPLSVVKLTSFKMNASGKAMAEDKL